MDRQARADTEIERLLGRLRSEGQRFLRERFKEIRKQAKPDEREMLHYKVLARAEVIVQASQFTFSRWCSDRAELEQEDARRLLEYLLEEGLWDEVREQLGQARQPDQYFWSLVHELESVRTTRQKLKDAAPGLYQLWRPSVVWPGRYVLGMLLIYFNPLSGAMRTLELHRMEGAEHGGLVQTPQITECLRGYLVKKSSQLLMHSFQQDTRSFQITVLANLLQQDKRILAMSGLCMGLIGQRGLFCRPLALVRQGVITENLEHALQTQLDLEGWPTAAFMQSLEAEPLYGSLAIVEAASVPEFVRLRLQESAGLSEFKEMAF